jgi:hypothetical protein
MNLNMEIGKKKDVYPSKKSINLYYQEDISTKISTVALEVFFVAVLVIALVKMFVIDLFIERHEALEDLKRIENTVSQQMEAVADFDKVSEEYFRYSYKILIDAIEEQDRFEILSMLQTTVFKDGEISNVSITGNVVTLSFHGLRLDETAKLIEDIQAYDMVENVAISNQTGSSNGTYEGNLTITLKAKNSGGEQ